MNTGSYNLTNCKYIIHTVGPRYSDYKDKNECKKVLEEAFFNTFLHASGQLESSSIAIPLISSGIYGVPRDTCCEALFMAIFNYIEVTRSGNSLQLIKIPSIDEETNQAIIEFFKRKFEMFPEGNKKLKEQSNRKSEIMTEDEEEVCGNKNPQTNTKGALKKANSIDSAANKKLDDCNLCETRKYIEEELKCGCKFCKDCVENYRQSQKCECRN